MMKNFIYVCVFLLFTCVVNAQPVKSIDESPSDLFNNFQKFSGDKPNVDAAFYCAKKLASNKLYLPTLNVLFHNVFAQHFIQPEQVDPADSARTRLMKGYRILGQKIIAKMMNDTTQALIESIRPLFLLTEIQDNNTNPVALKKLTGEFIKTEIEGKDIYKNRAGRYGLMISRIIEKQPELVPLNEKLLKIITADLKANQIKTEDATDRMQLSKRAWYRYLYAYANYALAEKTSNIETKEIYLKTAFDFSPDLMDKNNRSAYFYDSHMITDNENESFQDEYIDFITKNSQDRAQVLSAFVKIALVDTEYKDELETYYNSNSPTKSFASYWSEAINKGAPDAHPIVLKHINKESFSSKSHKGKWILVDFWGTWCVPCRAEHPDMQKFYDSTVVRNPDQITLLTIACRDTDEKVSAYMKEKKFSFPVAMSDQKIEKTYAVPGYPSKVLITPDGKYVTVPFGVDWVSFVKKYSGLN